MDLINKIDQIIPKMKLQLHSKEIFSLHEFYMAIAKCDPDNTGHVSKIKFENFLSLLGIFLKTQELTELYSYLETDKTNDYVQFENFISLFKSEPTEKFTKTITEIFNKLSNEQSTIPISNLREEIKINYHVIVNLLKKDKDLTKNYLEKCINFIIGEKAEMTLNEFIELHENMVWVMPPSEVEYWLDHICELWGVKLK